MIELIAGGARSGKSSYALRTAEALDGDKIFVATATVTSEDPSMARRIERHKAERSIHWKLIEEPFRLPRVVQRAREGDVLVIDCLTLWLSNWLCSDQANRWPEQKQHFLDALARTTATIFLVTNEVGMGVVPMGSLSRDFIDQSGWLHQDIAQLADKVTLVRFGIPTSIK